MSLLRETYRQGFFLIGVSSSKKNRLNHLIKRKGVNEAEAERLIVRDENEEDKDGQHTRETFHLADAFINGDSPDLTKDLSRIFDLLFGYPYSTPTKDEYAMFMAFSASLRSADLSRQVGAFIMSPNGECLATGANDVPCYPGGLYWSNDRQENRDHNRGFDSNEAARNEIVIQIMRKLVDENVSDEELLDRGRQELASTGIFDITEYGRAVHAEMEALLSCARIGVSTRGATLYSTTFPCHNCAKHVVAAGIRRVYIDLFSMSLGGGAPLRKKEKGEKIHWTQARAKLRFPMLPASYIDNEKLRIRDLLNQTESQNGDL